MIDLPDTISLIFSSIHQVGEDVYLFDYKNAYIGVVVKKIDKLNT